MNILEENTMFENLVEVLKANPRKIVYTEAPMPVSSSPLPA